MSVSEYATCFTEKMKMVPYLVPTELSKVNKFDSGLPTNFSPTVKLETTLKAAIWVAKNVETQIREKGYSAQNPIMVSEPMIFFYYT